jgi:hypothetical protein
MQKGITIKKIHLNAEDVLKHFISVVSGLEDKKILCDLIKTMSSDNIKALQIVSNTLAQMKDIIDKFYLSRIEEYRQSQKLRKVLGFVSSSRIEQQAHEHALADVQQLTSTLTGAEDKTNALNSGNATMKLAMEQLVTLVQNNVVNLNAGNLNKMLESDYEIE